MTNPSSIDPTSKFPESQPRASDLPCANIRSQFPCVFFSTFPGGRPRILPLIKVPAVIKTTQKDACREPTPELGESSQDISTHSHFAVSALGWRPWTLTVGEPQLQERESSPVLARPWLLPATQWNHLVIWWVARIQQVGFPISETQILG